MKFKISVLFTAMLSVGLVACNDDDKTEKSSNPDPKPEVVEPTPERIQLSF